MTPVPRRLPARHGWRWIVQGWALFLRKPITWGLFTAMTWLIVGLSAVHVFVMAAVAVLLPVLIAGWTLACRAAEAGQSIPVTMLFEGFRGRVRDLASIGALNLMGNMVLLLVLLAFGGDSFTNLMTNPGSVSAEEMQALQGRLSMALIVMLAIGVPLAMAVWFAPVAVVLDDQRGPAALMTSLRGILRNSMAFLVYSMVLGGAGVVLFALASAVGLSRQAATEVAFWILMPLIVTSVYASYRDIFAEPASTPPPE
ncbi:MAG: BPSS1780 family membrane protein [Burkholderiales bacterium]